MFRNLFKVNFHALKRVSSWKYPILGAATQTVLSEVSKDQFSDEHFLSKKQENSYKKIIDKAFKKLDYKGPVFLNTIEKEVLSNAEREISSNSVIKKDNYDVGIISNSLLNIEKGANVIIVQSPTKIIPESSLYAIAGHEAIHHLHKHELIQSVAKGIGEGYVVDALLKKHPMLVLGRTIGAVLGFNLLNKACEIDADVTSAVKLKTTTELVNAIKELDQKNPLPFFSYHPKNQTRIKYLEMLAKHQETTKSSINH